MRDRFNRERGELCSLSIGLFALFHRHKHSNFPNPNGKWFCHGAVLPAHCYWLPWRPWWDAEKKGILLMRKLFLQILETHLQKEKKKQKQKKTHTQQLAGRIGSSREKVERGMKWSTVCYFNAKIHQNSLLITTSYQ